MKQVLNIFIVGSILLSGQSVFAQSTTTVEADSQSYSVSALTERYPANSIQSSAAASSALADVTKARSFIESRFAAGQRACYKEFFTNSCLAKVKEQKRADLALIKPIEIEANAYTRHAKVAESDRRLAEKAAQSEGRATASTQNKTDAASGKSTEANDLTKDAQRKVRAENYAKKNADYAERQKLLQENEQADAKKRAENVERYEAKVRESAARQKEVAEKKAEKAREQANKQ
jgi:hypothetical protein